MELLLLKDRRHLCKVGQTLQIQATGFWSVFGQSCILFIILSPLLALTFAKIRDEFALVCTK